MICPVSEGLTSVVAERGRLSSSLKDPKRRLKELEVEIVSVKVEKKTSIVTLEDRDKEIRLLMAVNQCAEKLLENRDHLSIPGNNKRRKNDALCMFNFTHMGVATSFVRSLPICCKMKSESSVHSEVQSCGVGRNKVTFFRLLA